MKILFGNPESINPNIRLLLEKKMLSKAANLNQSGFVSTLITVQTVITLIILFITILFVHYVSAAQLIILSVFILLSVINSGAIMEQKKWVFHLDYARLILVTAFIYTFHPYPGVIYLAISILSFILLFYKSVSNWYYTQLYSYA
jgi:hypothetical protein